eukprot:TRINITY_DN18083_c0_g1_i2.p1 TRINITY_DN18083_c0_g1~~TRINITY_DN18083_c0_g1_i2.p1  ORF type:complete len:804 (+),score=166.43 TRINITY_DN18083_c0_g1_i2:100-2511(+)
MAGWGHPGLESKLEVLRSLSDKARPGHDELSKLRLLSSTAGSDEDSLARLLDDASSEQELPAVTAHRRWKASVDYDLLRLGTKHFNPQDPEHLWYAKYKPEAVKLWPERWYDGFVSAGMASYLGDQRLKILQESAKATEAMEQLKSEGDELVVKLELLRLQRMQAQQRAARRSAGLSGMLCFFLLMLPAILRFTWLPPVSAGCWDQASKMSCKIQPVHPLVPACVALMLVVVKVLATNPWQMIGAVPAASREGTGWFERFTAAWACCSTFLALALWAGLGIGSSQFFSGEGLVAVWLDGAWVMTQASAADRDLTGERCLHFESYRDVAETATSLLGSLQLLLFALGALAMALGELMKLGLTDWYIGKGVVDIGWFFGQNSVFQNTDGLVRLRHLQQEALGLVQSGREVARSFADTLTEFEEIALDQTANCSTAELRRLIFRSDLEKVAWPFALQAFALALWLPVSMVEVAPCLRYSEVEAWSAASRRSFLQACASTGLLLSLCGPCVMALSWWLKRRCPSLPNPLPLLVLVALLLHALFAGCFSAKVLEATAGQTTPAASLAAARAPALGREGIAAAAGGAERRAAMDYSSIFLAILGVAPFDPVQILLVAFLLETTCRAVLCYCHCCVKISLQEEDAVMEALIREQTSLLQELALEVGSHERLAKLAVKASLRISDPDGSADCEKQFAPAYGKRRGGGYAENALLGITESSNTEGRTRTLSKTTPDYTKSVLEFFNFDGGFSTPDANPAGVFQAQREASAEGISTPIPGREQHHRTASGGERTASSGDVRAAEPPPIVHMEL